MKQVTSIYNIARLIRNCAMTNSHGLQHVPKSALCRFPHLIIHKERLWMSN